MLWLRALMFSLLVPGVIAVVVPRALRTSGMQGGSLWLGWVLIVIGGVFYASPLVSFLAAGGTPAIFFTRRLRSVLGEEPKRLVGDGLYRYTRNPMYLGVVLVIFGQGLLYPASFISEYGLAALLCFHLVIVLVEEPHLRGRDPAAFEAYCRAVPRWLGLRGRRPR